MPGTLSSSIFKRALIGAIIVVCCSIPSFADSYLLYKEAQFVFGSDLKSATGIYYSQSQDDVMQKPSVGLDYIYKFSDETGDKAAVYAQGRFAWNELDNKRKIEPQLYNAYIKFKNPVSDFWFGHARVAYNLSSYLDSHSLLLQPLGMTDLGFDRDWGMGFLRDFSWGDAALTYTTGSGMPLYVTDTKLLSARVSYGVLNNDGYNIGISKADGTVLQAVGYEFTQGDKFDINYTGVDGAFLFDNYELRAENTSGARMDEAYNSFMIRGGVKFLDEDALKLELQQTAYTQGGESDHIDSASVSYILDESTTLRAMYISDELTDDIKLVAQVYYYAPW
jgi:hypothetical protein